MAVLIYIAMLTALSGVYSPAHARSTADDAPAALSQTYLPYLTAHNVQSVRPGSRTLISEAPFIARSTVVLPDNRTCVTYEIFRPEDDPAGALSTRLTHALTLVHGTVTADRAQVIRNARAPDCDAEGEPGSIHRENSRVACDFDVVIQPGDWTVLTCLYRESDDAVFTESLTISPEPFGRHDRNYNQIDDALESMTAAASAAVEVVLMFDQLPADLTAVLDSVDGRQRAVLPNLKMALASVPADRVAALRARFGAELMLIGPDADLPIPYMVPTVIVDGTNAAAGEGTPWLDPTRSRTEIRADRIAAAVLDTGADLDHPALAGRIRSSYSALTGNADVTDVDGQGTHVAAVIGGKSVSGAFEGVASDVDLVPVQAGSRTEWRLGQILTAVEWIVEQREREQIVAVNNSLSLAGQVNPFWSVAMRRAAEAGIVVVNAAGDIGPVQSVGAPGAEPLVLTVGAATSDGRPALYSSYSAGNAPVAKPDLLAPGDDILAARSAQIPGGQGESDYVLRSGTEVAAPIVTGAALHVIDGLIDFTGQDLDEDNRTDEDPWNGRDDDGDDLIDEDLAGWWHTSPEQSPADSVKRVKSILMMTANPPVAAARTDLGLLAGGHGLVNIDAAKDAVNRELCAADGGTFNAAHPDASSWARHVHLVAGQEYTLRLDAPDGTDFDLFLYRDLPAADGSPVIAQRPGPQPNAADGAIQATSAAEDKELTFSVRRDGLYFVVVKRNQGAGAFTVTLDDVRRTWTIMLYMAGELPGDASLDGAINAALNDLDAVGSGQGSTREVQVVALVDYDTVSWDNQYLLTSAGANAGDAVIYCIRKDYKDGALRYTTPVSVRHVFGQDASELNMGDPATLERFVAWSMARFPADRQGLIFFGDRTGHGWKTNERLAVGPGHDTDHPGPGDDPAADALTPAELSTALEAALDDGDPATPLRPLTFLGFDMGQMASLEVAVELEGVAEILIAPRGPLEGAARWPYTALLERLRCGTDCEAVRRLSAATLAEAVVDDFSALYGHSAGLTAVRLGELPGTAPAPEDCGTINDLAGCVSALGTELSALLHETGTLDDPADNGQMLLKAVRDAAPEGYDRSLVDLGGLAAAMGDVPALDAAAPSARRIARALIPDKRGLVIANGAADLSAGSLSIFFPTHAVAPTPECPADGSRPANGPACGFDSPYPSSALYLSPDSLALQSVMPSARVAPTDQSEAQEPKADPVDLRFVRQRQWDEFLQSYYRPVPAVCVLGEGGNCIRSIVIAQGQSVTMTAAGSSDGDLADGAELTYYWDVDPATDSAGPLPDYTTAPEEICSEDCDRNGHDGVDDDPDARGPSLTWQCTKPDSTSRVRLMVHDDRHTLPAAGNRTGHERWNTAAAELTIYCAVPPQANNDDVLLTHGPTASTQYRFVLVGNPAMASGAEGRLVNPIPPGIRLTPGNIEAGDGEITTVMADDGSVNSITWRGILDSQQSRTLVYQAAVDATARPLDQPYVVNQADFFDGVLTRTLAITTPAVALSVTPTQVTAGDLLTYTAVIPPPADVTEAIAFGVQYSRGGNPLTGGEIRAFPDGDAGPIDKEGGFWLWNGTLTPGDPLTFVFTMRVDENIEEGACGLFADSFAYVYEAAGLTAFDGPTYEILCPSNE